MKIREKKVVDPDAPLPPRKKTPPNFKCQGNEGKCKRKYVRLNAATKHWQKHHEKEEGSRVKLKRIRDVGGFNGSR